MKTLFHCCAVILVAFLLCATNSQAVSSDTVRRQALMGGVGDIREGTVISAILTGKIISWLTKRWQSGLQHLAFSKKEKEQNSLA